MQPNFSSPEAAATVAFLHDLEERCARFLAAHELNKGQASPANRIWPWSPGKKPAIPEFSQLYNGRKGAIISAVDVIKGLGKCTGMQVIEVPGATGFLDTNYDGKVAAALKAIEENDLVYVHLEAIDECSHLGDLKLKLKAIEDIDAKVVVPLLEALKERKEINFAILPDHPVPVKLRKHTTVPVPLAICGPAVPEPDSVKVYSESEASKGSLGFLNTDMLVKKLLGL